MFCRGKVNTVSFESQQFFPGFLCAGHAWFFGFFVSEGAEAREEDARGMFRASTGDSRCRIRMRHGRLRAAGFCGVVENRAGRTELMPNESEACVESGSELVKRFSPDCPRVLYGTNLYLLWGWNLSEISNPL